MRNIKKTHRILKANNAVEPAAPAFVWGNGVPGKCGATLNYDATMNDSEIRRIIQKGGNR